MLEIGEPNGEQRMPINQRRTSEKCDGNGPSVSTWVAPSLVVRFGAGTCSVAWSVDIRVVCKLAKRSENGKPRARCLAKSSRLDQSKNLFQKCSLRTGNTGRMEGGGRTKDDATAL
jgi:hypothetical protein